MGLGNTEQIGNKPVVEISQERFVDRYTVAYPVHPELRSPEATALLRQLGQQREDLIKVQYRHSSSEYQMTARCQYSGVPFLPVERLNVGTYSKWISSACWVPCKLGTTFPVVGLDLNPELTRNNGIPICVQLMAGQMCWGTNVLNRMSQRISDDPGRYSLTRESYSGDLKVWDPKISMYDAWLGRLNARGLGAIVGYETFPFGGMQALLGYKPVITVDGEKADTRNGVDLVFDTAFFESDERGLQEYLFGEVLPVANELGTDSVWVIASAEALDLQILISECEQVVNDPRLYCYGGASLSIESELKSPRLEFYSEEQIAEAKNSLVTEIEPIGVWTPDSCAP